MGKKKTKKTMLDTICRVQRSTNIGCDTIGLLGKINDLPLTWDLTIV